MRLIETSPNVYRLDHDPDRHDDRTVALALCVLHLSTQPSTGPRPVFFTPEEMAHEDLAYARAIGQVPPAVPLLNGIVGGHSAMPDTVHRDDNFDQSQNGKTKPTPFV